MARDVVTLRLDKAERDAIATAAAKQRLPFSEFLRQAALLVAHRLAGGPARPAHEPPQPPAVEPAPFDYGQHVVTTYTSFADYRTRSPYV